MATEIKKIVQKFLREKKQEVLERKKIERIVYSVFDDNLKPHVALLRVSKSRLVFLADSSASKFQINLMKVKIKEALKEVMPELDRITVRLGDIHSGRTE